jgi:hypothetical protein
MPKRMYEMDFGEDSLAEFNRLLAQANQSFEIPLVASEAAVSQPGPERNLQYEAVGKYIARESQILIALWDGVKSDNVGGTAAIVKFQTEGMPDGQACNLLPPELFPVYHILTPRASNPSLAGSLEAVRTNRRFPAQCSAQTSNELNERIFKCQKTQRQQPAHRLAIRMFRSCSTSAS